MWFDAAMEACVQCGGVVDKVRVYYYSFLSSFSLSSLLCSSLIVRELPHFRAIDYRIEIFFFFVVKTRTIRSSSLN